MRDKLIEILVKLNKELNGSLLKLDIPTYVDKIHKAATIRSIYKDGELKAFIAYYDNDENSQKAYLTMLAVSKDCWHLGYGKLLLEQSIKELREKGFQLYSLEVNKDNLTAIALYKKFGFKVAHGEEGRLKMEKTL
ncbi:GNAT family N-acetyltransferase [Aegicerativicinus sediminis]|uniref:GNAT family N-acetyltransferase n=1 Tax=Aegicerativicinus sediminis TaxID=2893202 RepID=UPI001E582101|nr:GNAT family N-acetyltransferase [Aegicerativicinus sediminis]